MADVPTTPAADVRPDPPRFRWLKRGTVGFLLLFAFLAGLRAWWGHEAQRRLDALAAAAHARGEPFWMEELQPPKVPDEQNATVLLDRAMNSGTFTPADQQFFYKHELGDPLPAVDLPRLAQIVHVHEAQVELVRRARDMAYCQWPYEFSHPTYAYAHRHRLIPSRLLANLLGWRAAYEHLRGNDGEAIESLHDVLTVATATDSDAPAVITDLVARGLDGIATHLILRTAYDLKISNGTRTAAKPEQVKALIDALLDERAASEGAIRDEFGERMQVIDIGTDMARGRFGSFLGWFLRPMYQLDATRVIEQHSAAAVALHEKNWFAVRSKLLPEWLPHGSSPMQELTRPVESLVGGWTYHPLQIHYHYIAQRRIAATALAIRLYAVDHNGSLPSSLAVLVPKYLPYLPQDPFRRDDGAIEYLPHHDPPILYSVGEDGKDQGGSTKIPPGTPKRAMPSPWETEDAVFRCAARHY